MFAGDDIDLEASGKFSVHRETVTEADVIDWIVDFTAYDVILSNYNGKAWQEDPEGLREYIEEGNLVVVHAADNSFRELKEYNLMIGLGGWGGRNESDGPYVYWKDGKVVRDNSKGRGGSHGRAWNTRKSCATLSTRLRRVCRRSFFRPRKSYDRLRGPGENMKILATALAKEAPNAMNLC